MYSIKLITQDFGLMKKITEKVKNGETLISDGAWGTFLQKKGLASGACPEVWNADRREDVLDVAKSYVEAGSDIIETNSFGGSRIKLAQYGLEERTYELNRKAAEISREAAGEGIVIGSIGPTGKFIMMGDVTEEELYNVFREQTMALAEGGADAICIETFYALDEAACAVKAAKENTECEVICTFTFEKSPEGDFKTMMGVSPEQFAETITQAGADIIGTNCGNGFEAMVDIVKAIRAVDKETPILVHANAGMPQIVDATIIYPETPEFVANVVPSLLDAGVNIIGGCCGTTPEHITAIKDAVKMY